MEIKYAKRNSISFYDWCIKNDRQDLLETWDYELNKNTPKDIVSGTSSFYYFKCKSQKHDSELWQISGITSSHFKVNCRRCNSFEQWCINNKHEEWLDLWDVDKNKCKPINVCASSGKKYFFKCAEEIHESEEFILSRITSKNRQEVKCRQCNSFAHYLLKTYRQDALNLFWDYEKNISINPYMIAKNSKTKVWIKCQEKEYHGSYRTDADHFTNGYRCPYCFNQKIHKYDSVGYIYPEILEIWSDKNDKSPYEYSPGSNKYIWLKCREGRHSDYKQVLNNSSNRMCNFRCPVCSAERRESYLEEKVRTYISDVYKYEIRHEYQCGLIPVNPKSNHSLPFDNEVIIGNNKLIIEVNGIDHYEANYYIKLAAAHNNTSLEYELHKRQLYDRYKRYVAFCNGYYYLAIPYWTEKDESYKKLIDEKIKEIKTIQESKQIAV